MKNKIGIGIVGITLQLVGCNYSLTKTPQVNDGIGEVQVLSFQTVNKSIIQPKCLECHSSAGGDAGGINLESYEQVMRHISSIQSEIASDSMPKNRGKLTAREKKMVLDWIVAGAPRNPSDSTGPTQPTQPPEPKPPQPSEPEVKFTYERVNREVIAPRCLNCHSASANRGGVHLETYESVVENANAIESEIQSGSMPRPLNKPLTPEQKELILKWLSMGTPK
jgi:uncharacterized membrane protein